MYKIKETNNYLSLSTLFHNSGMEVEIEETAPAETLKMWSCEDTETGRLLGGCVLQYKSDCLSKGWHEMDRATSPQISHCQSCEQFNSTCFPCIIRKEL